LKDRKQEKDQGSWAEWRVALGNRTQLKQLDGRDREGIFSNKLEYLEYLRGRQGSIGIVPA
jgi:hypothetical protein